MNAYPHILPMAPLILRLGESGSISCRSRNADRVSMFYKGQTTFTLSGRHYSEGDDTLVFEGAIYSHTGTVTCVAYNTLGSWSRASYIYVYGEFFKVFM